MSSGPAVCECGATVSQGDAWHMRQHQGTKKHHDAMATGGTAVGMPVRAAIGPMPVTPAVPPPAMFPDDQPQEPVKPVLRRMADILRGKQRPEPTEGTATLAFDGVEPPPVWPRNPVPIGEPVRRINRPSRGRPPGAEDIQPLLATGMMLLIAFSVGQWAAPTKEEADAISQPLANIIARRVDLAAKLGRDANDTIALMVALMVYLYRVTPTAVERVRSSLDDRSARSSRSARPANGPTEDLMAPRTSNVAGSNNGPAFDPLDAIARARTDGLRVLDRDFGYPPSSDSAMGDR